MPRKVRKPTPSLDELLLALNEHFVGYSIVRDQLLTRARQVYSKPGLSVPLILADLRVDPFTALNTLLAEPTHYGTLRIRKAHSNPIQRDALKTQCVLRRYYSYCDQYVAAGGPVPACVIKELNRVEHVEPPPEIA